MIYNGISIRKRAFIRKKRNTVLTIARLCEQKDYYTLLKSIIIVRKKIKDVQLLILSDGPLRRKLLKFIKKNNMNSYVKLLGWVPKASYLKKAKLFVFSSKREGFGYVLIEAMEYGLPVISTNTPFGPSEIIGNNKYGLLVPVGNYLLMAKHIINLLLDEQKSNYFKKQSLKRVRFFSEKKMLLEYKKLIFS